MSREKYVMEGYLLNLTILNLYIFRVLEVFWDVQLSPI
jgi:hypothetical protein